MTDPPPSKRTRIEDRDDERSSEKPEGTTFKYTGQPIEQIPRDITHLLVDPSVRRIEDNAFKGCQQLRSITIPSTVEEIGVEAFQECVSLVDVQLHEGLKSIGIYAFEGCTSLVEIKLPRGISAVDDGTFRYCQSLRNVSMPISLERIAVGAFADCKSLVDISLPKRLNHIGVWAFEGCESLSSVVFPQSLHTVGFRAFEGCTSLLCVEFQLNSNIQLGVYCFSSDKSLVNVSIPRLTNDSVFGDGRIDESNVACIENRFSTLPIHDWCYRSSVPPMEEMMQVLDDSSGSLLDESLLKDAFEMTPFHILASSASLNLEILQCLLDRYPTSILHYKDCYDYTMMDYLLKHTSSRAVPLLQMVLRQTVIETVSTWHPQWGNSLSMQIDMIASNRDRDQRRQCVKVFFGRVGFCIRMEMTSLLELAVWKAKIGSLQALEELNSHDTGWRESCRNQSKAGVVIGNVVQYLWNDEAITDTGLSLFPMCSSTSLESTEPNG